MPLWGNAGGWAAGILYAMANKGRRACGGRGRLNSELAAFSVSMATVRKRAAQVERLLPAFRSCAAVRRFYGDLWCLVVLVPIFSPFPASTPTSEGTSRRARGCARGELHRSLAR